MFCQMSYGGSFWSPKSIGSSSIKWEASEISSKRKAAVYALFQRKKVLVTRAHQMPHACPLLSIETASEESQQS